MDYIKLTSSKNWVKVDIDKLYQTQKTIFNKWREELPSSPIQNINNYTLHIIEELYESEIAETPEERLEETIDVLMYVMSSISAYELDPNFEPPIRLADMYILGSELLGDVPTTHDIINKLMEIRRMYPERKWHKPFDPKDINYFVRSKETIYAYMEIAEMVVKRLYIGFKMSDTEYINSKLNEKQGFISNLEDDNTKKQKEL